MQNHQSIQRIVGQKTHLQSQPQHSVSYIFRFADTKDCLLMALGTLAAVVNGIAYPFYYYLFALMNGKIGFVSNQELLSYVSGVLINYIELGCITMVTGWLMMSCWIGVGRSQAYKCRRQYFRNLLNQQVGWYDLKSQTEISLEFENNVNQFQSGIGQRIPLLVSTICVIVTSICLSFSFGWQLTLITCACFPLILFFGMLFSKLTAAKNLYLQHNFDKANEIASEVIGAIRTVKTLNAQQYELTRFGEELKHVNRNALKYSIYSSIGMSGLLAILFLCFGIGFCYSAYLIQNHVQTYGNLYTVSTVFVIFYAIFSNTEQLNRIQPSVDKITKGRDALNRIINLLDNPVTIKKDGGFKIQNLKGEIQFHNVSFCYPKEPNRKVLNNLSIKFIGGCKNAIVGHSGCGKTTIFQLILRFYDPTEGMITLDGINLKELDLQWLRNQIGYVTQQPILFSTTIKENLLLAKPQATQQELELALKKANASEFVHKLKDQINTFVGNSGSQLSGGQKQRIAIARALLRESSIMLFDESTSALDRQNERHIEHNLERIQQNITSISIAHRWKSIQNSKIIFVIEGGRMLQKGTPLQLQKFSSGQQFSALKHQDLSEIEISGQDKQNTMDTVQINQVVKQSDTHWRLWAYAKTDIKLYVILIIGAMLLSGTYPYYGVLAGKNLESYINLIKGTEMQSNTTFITGQWIVLAVWVALSSLLALSTLYMINQNLAEHIRTDVYRKILGMPMEWFDMSQNNPTNITALLSKQCQDIVGPTTNLVTVILFNIFCMIIGIGVATWYEWRVALVSLTIVPFNMVGKYLELTFSLNINDDNTQVYRKSTQLVKESTTNIKTIYALNAQDVFNTKYERMLTQTQTQFQGHKVGILFGLSTILRFFTVGFTMYFGIVLVQKYNISFISMIYARNIIFAASTMTGITLPIMPDVKANKRAAKFIFGLLDQSDQNQMQVEELSLDLKQLPQNVNEQELVFKNVEFAYKSSKQPVIKNLNMTINRGQHIALVGASGSGKSTIMQMLVRLYNPVKGNIYLRGIDIKDYNIHFLRGLFGVVTQQPILFNRSIGDNINYNNNNRQSQDSLALILKSFHLQNLQQDTANIGIKGRHLSGGERQRVAIARAILRNPQIILLDEATSALDSENQKIVQSCIEDTTSGKTRVSVAHRLETIRDCHQIYLLDGGQIVESGRYNELMEKQRKFYLFQKGITFKRQSLQ